MPPGGTTIYAGTDVPFLGCIFSDRKKFWGIIFCKIARRHKCWNVILEKITLWGIDFDQISFTWLKFWIVVTILGYTFQ